MRVRFRLLTGEYAICRLDAAAAVPAWADGEGFVSISRTDEELSIVCLRARVPSEVRHDAPWRALKAVGPFAFDEVGIAASFTAPLAAAGVPLFVVSTFDTDYLMLRASDFERAVTVLSNEGHEVSGG